MKLQNNYGTVAQRKVSSCASIFKFLYGPPGFFLRGKFIPKIAIFGDFGGRNAQTPLIRFVVDLLYNKLYNKQIHNKSTTNRSPTTNPQHLDMSRCCGFVVQQFRVHNKSATNRSNGVWIRFVVDLL